MSNTPGGTVTRIDPAKERFSPALINRRPVSVGQRPNGVVVGGGAVWVADTAADSVTRLDFGPVTHSGSTSKVHGSKKCSSPRIPGSRARTLSCTSATISVGKAPLGIAFGAGAVWVANSGDGTVSRIDPATGKVVATIHLGNSPRRVAVGDGKVWVTVQSA